MGGSDEDVMLGSDDEQPPGTPGSGSGAQFQRSSLPLPVDRRVFQPLGRQPGSSSSSASLSRGSSMGGLQKERGEQDRKAAADDGQASDAPEFEDSGAMLSTNLLDRAPHALLD